MAEHGPSIDDLPMKHGDVPIRYVRRKFRSQTSDNMDGWKSRGGKSQRRSEKRREEKKRGDQRRERVRRKKMKVREKFFPMIWGSGGSKVGETCSWEMLGGPGILVHQIVKFAKMILRDRRSTSYDLASLLDGVGKLQNVLVRGRQLCTQFSILEGSLAELLRFWCCQHRKLRKPRRSASFLTLSRLKIEEVSQNCCVLILSSSNLEEVSQNSFVFKLADRQTDRQTDRQMIDR